MDPPAEVLLSYLYPHFIFCHPTAPQLLLPPLYSLSLPSQPLPCFSGSQSLRLGFRPSPFPLSPRRPSPLLSSTHALPFESPEAKKNLPAPARHRSRVQSGVWGRERGAEYRGGGRYRWMRRWQREKEKERERERERERESYFSRAPGR